MGASRPGTYFLATGTVPGIQQGLKRLFFQKYLELDRECWHVRDLETYHALFFWLSVIKPLCALLLHLRRSPSACLACWDAVIISETPWKAAICSVPLKFGFYKKIFIYKAIKILFSFLPFSSLWSKGPGEIICLWNSHFLNASLPWSIACSVLMMVCPNP